MAILADVEDKHVVAEASLREIHEAEKRNTATALKYMEAFCARLSGTGQPHNRPITDQDRRELEKAQRARDGMEAKHQSAINVLRGEQGQRLRSRTQRQAREFEQLNARERDQFASIDADCKRELSLVRETIEGKRKRMELWWSLETKIWRKRLEQETGVFFDGKLPPVAWDDKVEVARIRGGDLASTSLRADGLVMSTGSGCRSR